MRWEEGGRGAVGVEGRVWWRGLGNSSGKNSFFVPKNDNFDEVSYRQKP